MRDDDEEMFSRDFNPYDALVELNERLMRVEQAHNALARAFEQTEREVNVILQSVQALQKAQLSLGELWAKKTLYELQQEEKGQK